MSWQRHAGVLGLLLAAVAAQQAARWTQTEYLLTPLTLSAYYALVVIGLCLLSGYAGQISLGHAGFVAIGGYTAAKLTTCDLSPYAGHWLVKALTHTGVLIESSNVFMEKTLAFHPWAACAAAIVLAAAVAFVIGVPVLKLRGHYLAMATLGFGMIVHTVVLAVLALGGADGISDVPAFPIVGKLAVCNDLSEKVPNFYIAFVLVAAGMWLLSNLIHSRVGRALRAIHGAEDAAAAMGVNVARYKLGTFVLSAVYAAIAGVFLTHCNGGIGPSEAGVMKSIRYMAIVAAGGMSSLWGALAAALLLSFLSLRGCFGSYDAAVFGAILIVIMLFAPQGLLRAGMFGQAADLWRRWHTARKPPINADERR